MNVRHNFDLRIAPCNRSYTEFFHFDNSQIFVKSDPDLCLRVSQINTSSSHSYLGSNVVAVDCGVGSTFTGDLLSFTTIQLSKLWYMRQDQKIASYLDPSLCLDVDSATISSYSALNWKNVRLWNCEDHSTESFLFPPVTPSVSKICLVTFPNVYLDAQTRSRYRDPTSDFSAMSTTDCEVTPFRLNVGFWWTGNADSWWLGLDGRLHTGYDSSLCLDAGHGAGVSSSSREEVLLFSISRMSLKGCDEATSWFFRPDGKLSTWFSNTYRDRFNYSRNDTALCLDAYDLGANLRLRDCDDYSVDSWLAPVEKKLRVGSCSGYSRSYSPV